MLELTYKDNLYPDMLKNIDNKPKKLYVYGNVNLLNSFAISVIGSRSHSEYGEEMCIEFTKELVKSGITIVSGLASGIDTIAHKTCLEFGGNTIAVLPCGGENIFPEENKDLFKDIITLGGTIVTEYKKEEGADSKKFIERNRIVAGLAQGTLVIESGYRSGTSITAQITMNQNKKVFCVPSSLKNKCGVTTNKIIQNGGKLVTCIDDILCEYNKYKFINNVNILNGNKINEYKESKIDKEYISIYRVLSNEPLHINEITKKTNLSIEDVNYKLMMLEIEEKIVQLPGKRFIRK